MSPEDGMAAMVVRDERTGKHVIAFRGSDDLIGPGPMLGPDLRTDLLGANYGQVGSDQFQTHKVVMDRWAKQYSKNGKIEVTGHSLGGGLAGLFAARYPDVVKRIVTFQAPAQLPASAQRYDEAMAKLAPEDRPENVAIISVNDAVSCAGTVYVGNPKILLTCADNMGVGKAFGHFNFVLQNAEFPAMWDHVKYRDATDNLIRAEMDLAEFKVFRSVAQLRGADSLALKARKWAAFTSMLNVRIRDLHMLSLMADTPNDGKTPLPVAVQDQVQDQLVKLVRGLFTMLPSTPRNATVHSTVPPYVKALALLRNRAGSDEVLEMYGRIVRFRKHKPGTCDVAAVASGFQSDFRILDLTADQIADGQAMVLRLFKTQIPPIDFASKGYVAAVQAYYQAYYEVQTKGVYSELNRSRLKQRQIVALQHRNSFPHNKVAKLRKTLRDAKAARQEQWNEGTRGAPRDVNRVLILVRERDRVLLRQLIKQIQDLDKKARQRIDAIEIPKDDWDWRPGQLFYRALYDKPKARSYTFLPSPPHPAHWGRGSKISIARLPIALRALMDNFRLFNERRMQITAALGVAEGLEDPLKRMIDEVQRIAKQIEELKAKNRGQ